MAYGDRLAVERRLAGSAIAYLHLGVDVGDGTVVHARPDDFRRPFGGGRIVRTSREEFADSAAIRVVTDPPAAFSPVEIVDRALGHVGRDGYCPVVANCEHFATWCATGRHSSRQVETVLRRVATVAAVACATVWVVGSVAAAVLTPDSGNRRASPGPMTRVGR